MKKPPPKQSLDGAPSGLIVLSALQELAGHDSIIRLYAGLIRAVAVLAIVAESRKQSFRHSRCNGIDSTDLPSSQTQLAGPNDHLRPLPTGNSYEPLATKRLG
jgi:hypothetical protein